MNHSDTLPGNDGNMQECIEKTGKVLNSNNQGIVKYLCVLEEERRNLEIIVQKQYHERKDIESEIERLTYKLCLINKSLSMRIKAKNNYEKTIEEIKQHYEDLVDSSNKLRQIVEKSHQDLDGIMNKKTGTSSRKDDDDDDKTEVKTLYVKSSGDEGKECPCVFKVEIPTREKPTTYRKSSIEKPNQKKKMQKTETEPVGQDELVPIMPPTDEVHEKDSHPVVHIKEDELKNSGASPASSVGEIQKEVLTRSLMNQRTVTISGDKFDDAPQHVTVKSSTPVAPPPVQSENTNKSSSKDMPTVDSANNRPAAKADASSENTARTEDGSKNLIQSRLKSESQVMENKPKLSREEGRSRTHQGSHHSSTVQSSSRTVQERKRSEDDYCKSLLKKSIDGAQYQRCLERRPK